MAQAIGALLHGCGVPVEAVAGRRRQAAQAAASFIGASRVVELRELPIHSRRILIAVADDAIPQVARELASCEIKPEIVLHTSGAAGPDALAPLRSVSSSVGIIHPLQTVPTKELGLKNLRGSAFACAGDTEAMDWARELVQLLDGKALAVDERKWEQYHAAAVMACNYHVTLVDAALELMEAAGIMRPAALEALSPLIRATTENILRDGPEAALTGPIRRGDLGTIQRHMTALETACPQTRTLYTAAALRTIPVAQRAGLEMDKVRQVATAIEERSSQ